MTTGGTLNTRQTYFPYGAKRVADGSPLPTGMDTTFTGQKSDDSTGLMYYGARYYDTTLGRFTQADTIVPNPMNPQSLNRYVYVLNNPMRYTDPTGHYECFDEGCSPGDPEGDDQEEEAPSSQTQAQNPTPTPTPPPANDGGNQNPNQNEQPDPSSTPAPCEPGGTPQPSCPPSPPLIYDPTCMCGKPAVGPADPNYTGYEYQTCNCTQGIGFNFNGAAGLGISIDVGLLTWDDHSLQLGSLSVNLMLEAGIGGSAMGYYQKTNGEVKDQEGWGGFVGASGGEGLGVGYDRVMGAHGSYQGDRISVGATAGMFPVEIHGGVGYTFFSPFHIP